MDSDEARTGVWFVYDGDCPVCSMAASALKIRKEHGSLHLLDARKDENDPLLFEIKERKLDLDEGMVIWCKGKLYHGRDALTFMARYGDDGWFNRINRALFRSEALAGLCYPWMRAARNLLLKVRGVSKLDNLGTGRRPVFMAVFGDAWYRLPKVMRRHYANRPYRNEIARVEGTLRVDSSPLGRLLKPVFRATGALIPYEGEDITVTVDFVTRRHSNAFWYERTFHFPGKSPYRFRSRMVPRRGNEVVEVMGPGLGWCSAFSWDGQKVVLAHRGYALRLFGIFIPLPLTIIMGSGYAEEIPIDDDRFTMTAEIRHPLWGKVFGYSGTFRLIKDI